MMPGKKTRAMTERVIEVVSVEKAYRFFHLAGVSLELEAGQILGFVGPNGAGKSILMRILMGMIRHDRGSVRVLSHPIPGEQAQAKRDVGFVSEDMRLHGNVTLAWYLKFVSLICVIVILNIVLVMTFIVQEKKDKVQTARPGADRSHGELLSESPHGRAGTRADAHRAAGRPNLLEALGRPEAAGAGRARDLRSPAAALSR
jgi:hypothetical protein